MELEKRIIVAMSLCMIIYMLFIYKQVSTLQLKCESENEKLLKRFDESDDFQELLEKNELKEMYGDWKRMNDNTPDKYIRFMVMGKWK